MYISVSVYRYKVKTLEWIVCEVSCLQNRYMLATIFLPCILLKERERTIDENYNS